MAAPKTRIHIETTTVQTATIRTRALQTTGLEAINVIFWQRMWLQSVRAMKI